MEIDLSKDATRHGFLGRKQSNSKTQVLQVNTTNLPVAWLLSIVPSPVPNADSSDDMIPTDDVVLPASTGWGSDGRAPINGLQPRLTA